jgi:hypothetical protein
MPGFKPTITRRLPNGLVEQIVDDYVNGTVRDTQPKGDFFVAMSLALSTQAAAETTNEEDKENE